MSEICPNGFMPHISWKTPRRAPTKHRILSFWIGLSTIFIRYLQHSSLAIFPGIHSPELSRVKEYDIFTISAEFQGLGMSQMYIGYSGISGWQDQSLLKPSPAMCHWNLAINHFEWISLLFFMGKGSVETLYTHLAYRISTCRQRTVPTFL